MMLDDVFRHSFKYDISSFLSTFRSKINQPIGRFDHFQVVFYDQYGMPFFDKGLKSFDKVSNVIFCDRKSLVFRGESTRAFLAGLSDAWP